MQFFYNHLIPKQCQKKKKNQPEHLLYVQWFQYLLKTSQKTEGSDF